MLNEAECLMEADVGPGLIGESLPQYSTVTALRYSIRASSPVNGMKKTSMLTTEFSVTQMFNHSILHHLTPRFRTLSL